VAILCAEMVYINGLSLTNANLMLNRVNSSLNSNAVAAAKPASKKFED